MPTPHGFVERLAELSQSGVPFVCVTMVEAVGSTPQDAGSKMLVTADGLVTGTVGGGTRRAQGDRARAGRCSPQPAQPKPSADTQLRRMEPQARRRHDLRRHREAVLRDVQPQRLADRRLRRRPRGQRGRRVPRPARLPRHVHRSAGRMARPHSRRARGCAKSAATSRARSSPSCRPMRSSSA